MVITAVPLPAGDSVNDPEPPKDVNPEMVTMPPGETTGVANVPAKLDSEMATVVGDEVAEANW
jgi:hypothetical protein